LQLLQGQWEAFSLAPAAGFSVREIGKRGFLQFLQLEWYGLPLAAESAGQRDGLPTATTIRLAREDQRKQNGNGD